MRTMVRRAGHNLRWYVRALTGESKWDDYLDRCQRQGTEPMSRREFERHQAEHREQNPQSRCC